MTNHPATEYPRRENRTRGFDNETVARALEKAAGIRESLELSRQQLFLDADGRRCDEDTATQASTAGCIRIAARAIMPGDHCDARDLRWHASMRFQRYIGQGIDSYDRNPALTTGRAAQELRNCAQSVRSQPAA